LKRGVSFAGAAPRIFDNLVTTTFESRQRLDDFEAGRVTAGNPMVEIVYPKDSGCDFVSPNEIKTHKNRGVAFRPKAPDPGGLWRNEKLTIEVEVFNLDGLQPWTASWEITMVQAKELSQWLTIRAKEAERGDRFNRLPPSGFKVAA
jgi:hypothetical protein